MTRAASPSAGAAPRPGPVDWQCPGPPGPSAGRAPGPGTTSTWRASPCTGPRTATGWTLTLTTRTTRRRSKCRSRWVIIREEFLHRVSALHNLTINYIAAPVKAEIRQRRERSVQHRLRLSVWVWQGLRGMWKRKGEWARHLRPLLPLHPLLLHHQEALGGR